MASVERAAVLGDRYRVEGEIGRGGMGVVIAAFDERLGRPVAIKLLDPAHAVAPARQHRFLREARAAAMLESEHVVRVHDAGVFEDAGAYLAMERLEGKDLQKALRERGRFSPAEAVEILVQACRAVAVAHESGVIHRDLKPSNLFLVQRSSGPLTLVKVLDFGISKITDDEQTHDSLTDTGSVLGSPRYMSPEQVRDAKRVGPASDIWALGVILYELLAGVPPFVADAAPGIFAQIIADAPRPLREQRPDVPAALAAICARCLQKRPEDRYADVNALARALVESSRSPFGVESESDVGGTQTTLDPLDPELTPPVRVLPRRPPSPLRRRVALGSIAVAASAALIPSMMASSPARRASPAVVAQESARPLVLDGPRNIDMGEPPKPEPRVATAPASAPVEVIAKTASALPSAQRAVNCDPPFVINPATMTRRVKPGC